MPAVPADALTDEDDTRLSGEVGIGVIRGGDDGEAYDCVRVSVLSLPFSAFWANREESEPNRPGAGGPGAWHDGEKEVG